MFEAFFQPFIFPTNERKAFCSCLLLLDFISQRLRVFHSEMNWKSKSKAYNKNCINSEVYRDHTESVGGWWKQSNPTTGVWKSFSHCKQFYPHSRTIYFYPTTMDNNQFVVVVAVILIQKCLILFSLFAAFFVLQICIPICHFQFSIYPFQLSLPKEKA